MTTETLAPTAPAPSTSSPAPPRRRRFRPAILLRYLILLPTFGILIAFSYYPAINGMFRSLFDWRPGFHSPFVGLANYAEMLTDSLWWRSFAHLGVIFVAKVTVMWALPLFAAELLISLPGKRERYVFRTLLIAPLAFPGVVTALVWSFMYDPNDGVFNRFLQAIGLSSWTHNWIGLPDTALGALLFIGFPWIATLQFLIFATTLEGISPELFEAASLDGAGRWRRFWAIDLPLLARQFRLLFFLAVIHTLQYGFVAYLLTQGGPDNATQVPVLRMLGVAFEGQEWGYAAALSTTLFLITLVFSALVFAIRGKGATDVRAL